MRRARSLVSMLGLAIGCDASVASRGSEPDAAAPAPIVDAGPVDPLADLAARAAVGNLAADWRSLGDAYAKVRRKDDAVEAYRKCAESAGDDFETSLYCQAAAAVARKVKPSSR